MEFTPFPKVPRLSRECVITEKLDGTNASVWIEEIEFDEDGGGFSCPTLGHLAGEPEPGKLFNVTAASRNRFITPGKSTDNFGFAAWVRDNAEELVELGPGVHYGEWWGKGIQRGYGLDEKRFSLFNVGRWRPRDDKERFPGETWDVPPPCCHVVPVLATGMFDREFLFADIMNDLGVLGSRAAPGYAKPEGIMIYHTAARQYFKKTFESDKAGKDASHLS